MKLAVKDAAGRRIDKELEARGVIARAQSRKGLAEEQPRAYKNVDDVVEVVHRAGLSRKVANVTFYYEHKGFSARISEWYRSDYRAYITNFGAPNFKGDVNPGGGFATAQAEKNVSAQVSYALQSGSMKGLTFFLQGYNLNDSPLITYNNGDPRQVINYQKYGASYSLGASYKF